MSYDHSRKGEIRLDRLVTLVDGAMAIVLTLLVLLVKLPDPHESDQSVLSNLLEQWHILVAYALSFILVAIYWLNHHAIFHYVVKGTLGLFWINLLFLLFVAFIPFPTTLLVDYPEDTFSLVIYGSSHILSSVTLIVMWRYLIAKPGLIRTTPYLIHRTTKKLIFAPFAYLLAIGLSFVEQWIGLAIVLSVPAYHLLIDRSDFYQFVGEEVEEESVL